MSFTLGTAVQQPDGLWAALCWLCPMPGDDQHPGYETETGAQTALRNHRRADHRDELEMGPEPCRCHCGNVHAKRSTS